MPRKIRELAAELEKAGFQLVKGAGKGSHRKYYHQRKPGFTILSGSPRDDAHHYQEKLIKNAIRQIQS